jgi:hypothetical protein
MTSVETLRPDEWPYHDDRTFAYDWLNPTFLYLKGYAESRVLGSRKATTALRRPHDLDETVQAVHANRPPMQAVTKLLPRRTPPIPTRLLGEWEGTVERVSGATFAARIVDLKGNRPEEQAEFDLEDVSPDDRMMVIPGGLFFWTIVRETKDGRPTQKSELRFRRLVVDPEKDIGRAKIWAAEVAELFKDSVSDD